VDYFTFSTLENKIWWCWWCPVCLPVTLVYCGQTVAYFGYCMQCWALIYRPGSACRTVLASSASASRGTKRRRQLHFQFASYVYEFTTSVILMCTSVAKRILIIKCTKFGRLILRKIIKILATRCHILRLKCTKFDFGSGSTPDPAGGAYSAPPGPLAGFKGAYF